MTLSRMHIGMLGVVSIFTGMISPVLTSNNSGLPFPLTDAQIYAYIVLLILSVICLLLAVRSWSWIRVFGIILVSILVYLFILASSGDIRTNSGLMTSWLSWWWVFLFIWWALMLWSMVERGISDESPSLGDHWLGWLWALTVLALTGLIISISYIPSADRSNKSHIIENILGKNMVETSSGVTKSIPYPSIEKMIFDRKKDALSFFTSSGTKMISLPSGRMYERLPYTETTIGNNTYTITAEWYVSDQSGVLLGRAILPQLWEGSILMYSGSSLISLNTKGIKSYSGEYATIEDITTTREWDHIIWKSKTGSGYTLYKDGRDISEEFYSISDISPTSDGQSIMVLIGEIDGTRYIVKNGTRIQKITNEYIPWSIRMNGTDYIYAIDNQWVIELIHNGSVIDRKFDEIREIFLDRDGGGYVYFGRPLGEQTYCLYTRYRGNLCGLSGYMNPRQSPDSSVIYAALRDGAWGIYRNASPIIRNTGYPSREDISGDYVFFDITNPSYYLFIRSGKDGYNLYKKWAWIEGIYKDVWLDATFGYDNKVIMSVQDDAGWRVIEF